MNELEAIIAVLKAINEKIDGLNERLTILEATVDARFNSLEVIVANLGVETRLLAKTVKKTVQPSAPPPSHDVNSEHSAIATPDFETMNPDELAAWFAKNPGLVSARRS